MLAEEGREGETRSRGGRLLIYRRRPATEARYWAPISGLANVSVVVEPLHPSMGRKSVPAGQTVLSGRPEKRTRAAPVDSLSGTGSPLPGSQRGAPNTRQYHPSTHMVTTRPGGRPSAAQVRSSAEWAVKHERTAEKMGPCPSRGKNSHHTVNEEGGPVPLNRKETIRRLYPGRDWPGRQERPANDSGRCPRLSARHTPKGRRRSQSRTRRPCLWLPRRCNSISIAAVGEGLGAHEQEQVCVVPSDDDPREMIHGEARPAVRQTGGERVQGSSWSACAKYASRWSSHEASTHAMQATNTYIVLHIVCIRGQTWAEEAMGFRGGGAGEPEPSSTREPLVVLSWWSWVALTGALEM